MTSADPFGLWQEAPARASGEVSYAPGEEPPEEAAAIWQIDTSGGTAEIERRAQAVVSIEAGLAEAEERLERFLSSTGETGRQVSYDSGPSAETMLLLALSEVDPERFSPGGLVSYGWQDLLNWGQMRERFQAFTDWMDRQVLNFVWVETSENGRNIARTKINWTGDLNGYWLARLTAAQVAAHEQSLQVAVKSRAANLKLYLHVIQMAIRILRAVSTPLGALDALALAWQFVQDVILPLIKENAPAGG